MQMLTKEQFEQLLKDEVFTTNSKTPERVSFVLAMKRAKLCTCGCGKYIIIEQPDGEGAMAYLKQTKVGLDACKADISDI
jgi:hypothetical protein